MPPSSTRTSAAGRLTRRICLACNGYAIEEASDGREALVKAFIGEPDVIITPAWLLGIDVYNLCQLLPSDDHTCQIPIVMVAGGEMATDIERAQALGVDAFLTDTVSA